MIDLMLAETKCSVLIIFMIALFCLSGAQLLLARSVEICLINREQFAKTRRLVCPITFWRGIKQLGGIKRQFRRLVPGRGVKRD